MYAWEHRNSGRFVRHESCPACGSRDNLGRYEGGSAYCFGCGYYERAGTSGTESTRRERLVNTPNSEETGVRSPPDDTTIGLYPNVVMEWVGKYGLSAADLIRHKVGWSKKREQLIYQFYDGSGNVILWQARNFRAGTTHKDRFYTCGKTEDVIAEYRPREDVGKAVIVEDCVSAIVCSHSGASGIPCFGSSMQETKLARIAKLYRRVFVWLDQDKLREANTISRRLGLLGVHATVLSTKEDPKCYPIDFIESKIR